MLFWYKALKNDKPVTGKVEASDLSDAIAYLKHNSYFPIVVKPADATDLSFIKSIFNRAGFNEMVDFTRQIAIMLNAGLTLIDCFDILKKQTNKGAMFDVISSIDKQIRGGESFSTALKKHPYLFSNLYIALVEAGEASGKLSEVLIKLAENLEQQREFNGKIKGALIYPVIVIVGMIIVMFIMITFVVPKLLNLYKDFNVDLPLTTKILIAVSDFSGKFWPIIVGGTLGAVFLGKNYLKTKQGKFTRDTLLLRLPIVSNVIRMSALVDSTRTLAILIGSGVSILDSINIIIETSSNVIYQQAFRNIYVQLEKGTSLGQAMTNEKVFPPILIQMTNVGEQTGHLDNTLLRISRYFELESELAIKALTALIEPAIIVVLGIGVGLLVVAVITPIYNLTNKF